MGTRAPTDPEPDRAVRPGERIAGMRTNSYVLSSGGANVFVGTEARTLSAIRDVAASQRIDVAILPVNGIRLLGRPLVMDTRTAIEATRQLGAHTLVPIHYSQHPIRPILRPTSGRDDLTNAARHSDLQIEVIAPGQRTLLNRVRPEPFGPRHPYGNGA